MNGIAMNENIPPREVSMLREIWAFIRRHWLHVLLVPPGALLVTVLHESAHAFAVWVQGGTILEFVWLPTTERWGYVSYDPPVLRGFSTFFVSIAPYLLWLFLAAVAAALSLRRRPYGFAVSSSLYFWLFVVPLADVANAAFPYLDGRSNDFLHAFGPPSWTIFEEIALLSVLALIIGHPVQRRLYRTLALRLRSYLVLSLAAVFFIVGLTVRIF
ncbi:MAG: M50 family metallopeptidase [Verrucomicrobia bacterium]|nr:M50 family metallopeptidase [Verrucomicrobiota bacterium]